MKIEINTIISANWIKCYVTKNRSPRFFSDGSTSETYDKKIINSLKPVRNKNARDALCRYLNRVYSSKQSMMVIHILMYLIILPTRLFFFSTLLYSSLLNNFYILDFPRVLVQDNNNNKHWNTASCAHIRITIIS